MSLFRLSGACPLTPGSPSLATPVAPLDLHPRIAELWRMAASCTWRAARLWVGLVHQDLAEPAFHAEQGQLGARLARLAELLPLWERHLVRVNRAGLFEFAGRRFVSACHAALAFAADVRGTIAAVRFDALADPPTELPWPAIDWHGLAADPPPDPESVLAGIRREALLFDGKGGPSVTSTKKAARSAALTTRIMQLRDDTTMTWKAILKLLKDEGFGKLTEAAVKQRYSRQCDREL